ncbi:MAG: hypothetical protein IT350_02380 [Deltaproteobacteria bacterium]|nr:hypothetical protein [Deltaproteobacteria bacterium]
MIEAARTEGMVAHSAKVWGPAALAAIRAAEMRPPPRIRQIPVERRAKKMAKAKLRRDCKEFQKSGVENE